MDLAGPKLRTGQLDSVESPLRFKPKRDSVGRVIVPARVWLTYDARPIEPPVPADITVRVAGEWLSEVKADDEIRFTDARGRGRAVRVVEVTTTGVWGESDRSRI